jgi:hypothetical protein
MPRSGIENHMPFLSDMPRPRDDEGGAVLATGVRNYLRGMPYAILEKSYDRGIAWDLARCHDTAHAGCGKKLGAFRVSLH